MNFALNDADVAVVCTSLAITVIVGLWASRKQGKSADTYFLASKKLPWYIIGAAFVSTSVSSEQLIGTIGATYITGMGVANWEWFMLCEVVAIFVFFPLYLASKI